MTCKVVVISGNYTSTKQCALLLERKRSSCDAGFFQLKVANFVAINGNRGTK